MFRKLALTIGVLTAAAGLIVLMIVPAMLMRSKVTGSQLLKQAKRTFPAVAQTVQTGADQTRGQHVDGLIGRLDIPKLKVTAPIVQGTEDKEINVAVGHLVTSVDPGKPGTCLLAAHNATWFRHIDRLRPGDFILVTTQTGQFTYEVSQAKIVRTGTAIPDSIGPSLDLESCYPLDALYLTPYRYVITANLKAGVSMGARKLSDMTFDVGQHYQTPIPERIVREGITLQSNTLPMGTLTYKGHPADAYMEGNSPLNAASQMVELYLAVVHASADQDESAMHDLLPYARLSANPLWDCSLRAIQYVRPYDIQLVVYGNQLVAMNADTTVRLNGTTTRVSLQATVDDHHVSLVSVSMSR